MAKKRKKGKAARSIRGDYVSIIPLACAAQSVDNLKRSCCYAASSSTAPARSRVSNTVNTRGVPVEDVQLVSSTARGRNRLTSRGRAKKITRGNFAKMDPSPSTSGVSSRPRQVQLVGDLPPAPKFSKAQLEEAAEAAKSKQNGDAESDESEDEDAANGVESSQRNGHADEDEEEPEGEEIDDAALLDRYPPDETVSIREI